MGKLIKYAVILGLAYVAYTEGPKWVEQIGELGSGLGRKGGSVGIGRCVAATETASETFARGMRDFSKPPVDIDAWDHFMEGLKGHMYDAENECSCARDSCQRASEALDELRSLMSDFDGSLRGSNLALNPARRQETIDRLLKRARELDRQGS